MVADDTAPCVAHAHNISNVDFDTKISIPPEPTFKNMGQQMVRALGVNPKIEGSSPPQVETFSAL